MRLSLAFLFVAVLSLACDVVCGFHILYVARPSVRSVTALSSKKSYDPNLAVGCGRRIAMSTFYISTLLVLSDQAVDAVVMDSKQAVFKVGQTLSTEEAIERLKEGRKSAQYLFDHYDEIAEVGGDNVRRYLGTVGTSSGLFGIGKVMSTLADGSEDFVEYTEISDEVLKSIQQADGSAYMAIFVTTSTSQTPPSKYFGDAKIELKRCIKALDELAALVDVKF